MGEELCKFKLLEAWLELKHRPQGHRPRYLWQEKLCPPRFKWSIQDNVGYSGPHRHILSIVSCQDSDTHFTTGPQGWMWLHHIMSFCQTNLMLCKWWQGVWCVWILVMAGWILPVSQTQRVMRGQSMASSKFSWSPHCVTLNLGNLNDVFNLWLQRCQEEEEEKEEKKQVKIKTIRI